MLEHFTEKENIVVYPLSKVIGYFSINKIKEKNTYFNLFLKAEENFDRSKLIKSILAIKYFFIELKKNFLKNIKNISIKVLSNNIFYRAILQSQGFKIQSEKKVTLEIYSSYLEEKKLEYTFNLEKLIEEIKKLNNPKIYNPYGKISKERLIESKIIKSPNEKK